ncbi:MAG: antibiotic biosynthesis monooxygenase family protein [Leptolyngbyaceae cyanobacterium bins.302]|nr:antibiotic biosynthesis monooxygenase family protein [Leptolyngbyaceae cyanobacterium bins.302]
MLKPAMINKLVIWLVASAIAIVGVLLPATSASAVFVPVAPVHSGHLLLAKNSGTQEPLVTLANQFTVAKDQLPDFLDRWSEIGKYMKQQPGFVSAELKKDILNSQEWMMSEQWKSLADYKRAVSTEAFQALVQDFPGKATWFAQDLFPTK